MRRSPPILAIVSTLALLTAAIPTSAQHSIEHALDLAESRYQQASRETYLAQRAFDDAVARSGEIGKTYQAALNEQRTAGRLLADANVNGPRIADAVRQAEAAVELERQKVAPQYAPVEAAAAEHRRALARAMAALPEWSAARDRVAAVQENYDAVVDDRLAELFETAEYVELLAASWDAQDAAVALRDAPNADENALIEATQGWMASLDALEQYEAEALDADPAVGAVADALSRETANQEAVHARLAPQVADDPEVQHLAAALAAAEGTFQTVGVNLHRAQAALDAQRGELARIDQVAASARQRLARVEKELPALSQAIAHADEAAKRAEADLVAAQNVEQRSLQDREVIAADLSRTPLYPPEPVYIEPPIVIVDGGTTIYYPPGSPKRHHDHDRDRRDHDKDRDHGHGQDRDDDRDRDRGHGGTRRDDGDRDTRRDDGDRGTRNDDGDRGTRHDDGDRGTRRDDGSSPTRRDDGVSPARRDEPGGARREEVPSRTTERPTRSEPQTPPKASGDDAATARRKQEEAKAAERQRREDGASAAAARQQQESAQAESRRQQEESSRQRQQQESSRQRQQSEVAAREQQRQRESQPRETSRNEDRGSRYQRDR